MKALKFYAVLLGAGFLAAGAVQAATTFAQWDTIVGPNQVDGSLGGVGIHYIGQVENTTQVGNLGAIQYWTEYGHDLPYTPITGNLPTRTDIVTLSDAGTHTIRFDQPVLNPIMLICSLGQPSYQVTYTFNQPATVLNYGWSYWNEATGNLGYLVQGSGNNVVVGAEGAGVVGFSGWVSSITWTTDVPEYWHGITLGVVPEPTTILAGAMLLVPFGLSTVRVLRNRKS